MKKTVLCVLFLAFLAVPMVTAVKPGTDLRGKHYNLNIIGVAKDKNSDAGGWTDTSRHTIFVELYGKTNIYMQQGENFAVIDADGTDGKARFQLGAGYYEVYAVALGRPSKWVVITPEAEWLDPWEGDEEFALGSIELSHNKKPKWERVTGLFIVSVTLLNTDTGETKTYRNVWIFDIPELFEYWWEYDNHGQKLVQVRFYEVPESPAP